MSLGELPSFSPSGLTTVIAAAQMEGVPAGLSARMAVQETLRDSTGHTPNTIPSGNKGQGGAKGGKPSEAIPSVPTFQSGSLSAMLKGNPSRLQRSWRSSRRRAQRSTPLWTIRARKTCSSWVLLRRCNSTSRRPWRRSRL